MSSSSLGGPTPCASSSLLPPPPAPTHPPQFLLPHARPRQPCSSVETWILALNKATAVLPSSPSWGKELAQILLSLLSSEEPLPLLQTNYRKDKSSSSGGWREGCPDLDQEPKCPGPSPLHKHSVSERVLLGGLPLSSPRSGVGEINKTDGTAFRICGYSPVPLSLNLLFRVHLSNCRIF